MSVAMANSLRVRPMEAEDLDQIMLIENASYDFCWTKRIFRDCLKAGYCCLVLAEDDEVHGYSILMVGPHDAHILNICIENVCRGQGWARHLMLEMMDMVSRVNCKELYLEVRPSNAIAIRLYESLGFNEIGVRSGYYKSSAGREDALVMALSMLTEQ